MRGQPPADSGAGDYSPQGNKTGEGGMKMKFCLASLRAKGRVSMRGGSSPLPSRGARVGVQGQAARLGVGGPRQRVRSAQRGLPR